MPSELGAPWLPNLTARPASFRTRTRGSSLYRQSRMGIETRQDSDRNSPHLEYGRHAVQFGMTISGAGLNSTGGTGHASSHSRCSFNRLGASFNRVGASFDLLAQ